MFFEWHPCCSREFENQHDHDQVPNMKARLHFTGSASSWGGRGSPRAASAKPMKLPNGAINVLSDPPGAVANLHGQPAHPAERAAARLVNGFRQSPNVLRLTET